MKKIIYWGDGILSGPAGYAELLIDYVFLNHPRADVANSIYGGERATLQAAMRETPLHAIGRALDLIILGFGYTDLSASKPPGEIAQMVQSVTNLMLQKTQAHVCLPNLASSFFAEDREKAACSAVNGMLAGQASSRVTVLDLESRVEDFLEAHRQGPGEKRSLHLDSHRLTLLGRLFLAHHAFGLIPWPHLEPGLPEAAPA